MNLSAPFIKRPIGTTLLAIGLALAGIIAFNLLPVSSLPQVEFPTISIQASLPGASPATMASSVATPLERYLGHIAGITQMTSSSTLGGTSITIQFDLDRNIDGAARDVQAAINAARSQLPANMPSNPTYRKVNPSDAPIMIIALTSSIFSAGQMYDAASSVLQQKIAQINGVGQVVVGGSSLPAVRVELNPMQLSSYKIALTDVAAALAATNSNRPKGQLVRDTTTSELEANDQLFKAEQYKPIIITYRNNNPVRISDVAEVVDSVEDVRNAGLANNKPAIVMMIYKQPGSNIIDTVANIRQELPQLEASIPAAINTTVVMDRTTTIRASLHDIEITLLIAMALVILVSYLFLGSIRAMIIPGVAVPLSLLGTFVVMLLLGFNLDNLSLIALTIATGFVVDDAIVVLENIARHIEQGFKPIEAALLGAKEVGFTVISMSLSLIAVFIPILLMSGIVGRLFREFAITLSIAILVSLLVSLTVTPMMCAWFLKHQQNHAQKPNRYRLLIEQVNNFYQRTLRSALDHSRLMLLLTVATLLFTVFLFVFISKGFFPEQDTGRIAGSIQGDQNSSFQAMREKMTAFIAIITSDPAVQNVVGVNSTTSGNAFIALKPLAQRDSAAVVINRLRKKLAVIKGATLYLKSAQDLVIGGRSGNAQFQYTLSADSLEQLNTWTPLVMQRIAKLPGIVDVNSDQRTNGLQVFVTIDRDTAARLGITPDQIMHTLYSAFGQSQVSVMYTPMNQYHVVMEVAPKYWQFPTTLDDIYIITASGDQVPLSAVAHYAPSSTLLSVNHQGLAPSATITFNLLPNYSLGDAVNIIQNEVAQVGLPAGVHASFQGTAQAFQTSLANEPYLILAALLAVYIVLGMLYESLIHPITILSTLPSAGVGALLALMITGIDLSMIAFIGVILLIGIVKKNAIMMIDFAIEAERNQQLSAEEAIYQAAVLRFRPILMTTLAAMFGALPLALGYGIGAELRQPLGVAIIGGLIVSQVLTLYTTPVIYLAMEDFAKWYRANLSPRAFIQRWLVE